MRALTLWQPWGFAVMELGKPVENRSWLPPEAVIGTRIAIHAGKVLHENSVEALERAGFDLPDTYARSAILGTVLLAGWVRQNPDRSIRWSANLTASEAAAIVGPVFWQGPVGWVLRDPIAIEPVPCRGAQGLWHVPFDVAGEVEARLARATASRGAA